MAQLTAAGIQFCIAIMGTTPATERDCIMGWFRHWEKLGCPERNQVCSYITGGPAGGGPYKLNPGFECFHFSGASRHGVQYHNWMCDRVAPGKDEGPPVS